MSLPTPYYERGGIVIYHGDYRDVLPTLDAIDILLTDPPFFLPAQVRQARKHWPRSIGNLGVMGSFFRDVVDLVAQLLKPTGAAYVFSDSTSYAVFLAAIYPLFDRTQCIVWDKGQGGLGRGWRHSHEFILHGAYAQTAYAPGFRTDVIRTRVVPSSVREHGSEKPVDLLRAVLLAHDDGIVLDPFMGSGTTLIAALNLGRRAIGIEIEERYCEIAARRLQQDVLPLEVPA